MCGICGIWSPRDQATADPAEAARLMFFSLYALQHRGQESAGIAATDGRDLRVVRRMGLVGQVFGEPDLSVLTGRAAMGHTRYSTTGASKIQNAQPFTVRAEGLGELAIGHNGNCINAREIRDGRAAVARRRLVSRASDADGALRDPRSTRRSAALPGPKRQLVARGERDERP